MAQDPWKQRWKEIGPERRRAIYRAIRRGEAVSDVRDAPLAVELIDRRRRRAEPLAGTRRFLSTQHLLVFVGLALALGIVGHDFTAMLVAALVALYLIPLRFLLNQFEARSNAAREKNAELASLFYDRKSAAE